MTQINYDLVDIDYMKFIKIMYNCYNINQLEFVNNDIFDFTPENIRVISH